MSAPMTTGTGLVNLVAELEHRLTGDALGPTLDPGLGALIPDASGYVVVLFDGLGVAQLAHPEARSLKASLAATIRAPFPTTTSVSLATVATGLTPAQHGLTAHLAWFGELGQVVNTLKWVDLAGRPVNHDYSALLPAPNLWERVRKAGVEPITVQPAPFGGSPLSRVLYRGARFESAWDEEDLIDATVQLAGEPGRLIFTYVWKVDFAGHVSGLGSAEFTEAIRLADRTWDQLASRLPPDIALIGTADHGLVEYAESDKILIRGEPWDEIRFAGDPRGVHAWAEPEQMTDLVELTGATLCTAEELFGDQIGDIARRRMSDAVLLAPEGKVILPPGFDKRLRAYHGGLSPTETEIPLLVS